MKRETNKYYYKEENIEGDFYKVCFGIGIVEDFYNGQYVKDVTSKIYRYILLSDLEKSEKLTKAVKKFENAADNISNGSINNRNIYTTITEDKIKTSIYSGFYLELHDPYQAGSYKLQMACEKLLKTAAKEGIKLYTKSEVKEYNQNKEEQM